MSSTQSSAELSNEKTWKELLSTERSSDYFTKILDFVSSERSAGKVIYPPNNQVFAALSLTPFDNVKVVIIGQDPYHGAGQAHGLAFSVQEGVALPPSLKNIYLELQNDLGIPPVRTGCLTPWAKQGVLLLNTSLTVEASKPASHSKIGWETFTDRVVNILNSERKNIVFMLWGAHAQKKGAGIDPSKHLILKAPHPSPFSAHTGFFGCKHFSKANEYLKNRNLTQIEWNLANFPLNDL